MSNRLFQGVIHQMRDAVDRTIGVIDETGTIISCSELGKIGEVISNASQIFAEDGDRIVNGCTYRSFGSHMQAEYAVFIDGEDELAILREPPAPGPKQRKTGRLIRDDTAILQNAY